MKNNILFKIGTAIGLLTLTVGLGIFMIWWGARSMFALNLYHLEDYGFIWILFSIPLATIGLILNIIYLVRNCKNYLKKSLVGVAIVLLNIPIVIWVLNKQLDIKKRAYVQINFEGINDLSSLKLESDYFEKDIGTLRSQSSKIVCYYPEYIDDNKWASPPAVKPIMLKSNDKEVVLPRIGKGECRKIFIDKDYILLERRK